MATPRNVTPLVARIRDLFLQRKYNNSLRFEGVNSSKRTQPPPDVPDGPSHKLSANYYFTRDGRNEMMPPKKVYDANQQLLTEGSSGEKAVSSGKAPVRAGFGYDWDTGRAQF
ncbi:NADH dehydrogenase [ubiquinone] 1 alpha subcomplex subunit 7-like [Haliotis rufescens]|uniref:NADH dehydrogenase [ubiquinone] 1 alpha subcomplex subunit 7-like n=1 Tax=Haliotis rufescens TaxID=6454 RepID=UPI00201EB33B|nr:NADH dehydrogenase [ubiquinone] 1 alpha subcomplex subunit 7-like [Haliotis rufescens]